MNGILSRFRLLPIIVVLYVAFLYAPVMLLPVFSLNDSQVLSFPLKGFTTQWYAALAEEEELLGSLVNSLVVATLSALIATALGALAARAITRFRIAGLGAARAVIMTPLVMPEIIVAISLLILFLAIGFSPSLIAVVVGHVLLTVPFTMSIMTSSFEQFDDSLEEAAIDLGENEWGALLRVTLPVVMPGLISSALVAFTVSFDEFILAFFLSGADPTLPVYIWGQVRFPAKLPDRSGARIPNDNGIPHFTCGCRILPASIGADSEETEWERLMTHSKSVSIRNVDKHYGKFHAVRNLSLDLEAGEFFSLLGPSGCGKSTLLRMIAGFEKPSSGNIEIDGKEVGAMTANHRPTNMVFQSYAIFPHLNVAENIAFGLRKSGLSKPEKSQRVEELLDTVGLGGLGERSASELSGGQRQRVALARALILRPKVLLLDEPLSALDKKLREKMQLELRRLQRAVGVTFLMVTHDQSEAMAISDRIGVMFDGKLSQVATPRDLYERPATRKVADFIGGMNILKARAGQTRAQLTRFEIEGFGPVDVPNVNSSSCANGEATLGIRPERLHLFPEQPDDVDAALCAIVDDISFYGESVHYHLRFDHTGERLDASVANTAQTPDFAPGDQVWAGFRGRALVPLP